MVLLPTFAFPEKRSGVRTFHFMMVVALAFPMESFIVTMPDNIKPLVRACRDAYHGSEPRLVPFVDWDPDDLPYWAMAVICVGALTLIVAVLWLERTLHVDVFT